MEVKVSVIIPTYNRAHLISETLKSVLDQSISQWECIIVDDGSTDNTKEVVEGFLGDKRFTYHSRPNNFSKGAAGSRNFGFELSKGKYIQWLDDDDMLSKRKLEYQVTVLESMNSNYFACSTWDYYWPGKTILPKNFFEDGDVIGAQDYFYTLAVNQTFVPLNAFLIPKVLCDKAGNWNEKITLNDDAEYITRVLLNSEGLKILQGCYALYRNHSEERLSRKMDESSLSSLLSSLELIDSYLKTDKIMAKEFFRWKLLNVFHNYKEIDKKLLEKYKLLFQENGIYLKLSWYYKIKHFLYLKSYPVYKKIKNRNQ